MSLQSVGRLMQFDGSGPAYQSRAEGQRPHTASTSMPRLAPKKRSNSGVASTVSTGQRHLITSQGSNTLGRGRTHAFVEASKVHSKLQRSLHEHKQRDQLLNRRLRAWGLQDKKRWNRKKQFAGGFAADQQAAWTISGKKSNNRSDLIKFTDLTLDRETLEGMTQGGGQPQKQKASGRMQDSSSASPVLKHQSPTPEQVHEENQEEDSFHGKKDVITCASSEPLLGREQADQEQPLLHSEENVEIAASSTIADDRDGAEEATDGIDGVGQDELSLVLHEAEQSLVELDERRQHSGYNAADQIEIEVEVQKLKGVLDDCRRNQSRLKEQESSLLREALQQKRCSLQAEKLVVDLRARLDTLEGVFRQQAAEELLKTQAEEARRRQAQLKQLRQERGKHPHVRLKVVSQSEWDGSAASRCALAERESRRDRMSSLEASITSEEAEQERLRKAQVVAVQYVWSRRREALKVRARAFRRWNQCTHRIELAGRAVMSAVRATSRRLKMQGVIVWRHKCSMLKENHERGADKLARWATTWVRRQQAHVWVRWTSCVADMKVRLVGLLRRIEHYYERLLTGRMHAAMARWHAIAAARRRHQHTMVGKIGAVVRCIAARVVCKAWVQWTRVTMLGNSQGRVVGTLSRLLERGTMRRISRAWSKWRGEVRGWQMLAARAAKALWRTNGLRQKRMLRESMSHLREGCRMLAREAQQRQEEETEKVLRQVQSLGGMSRSLGLWRTRAKMAAFSHWHSLLKARRNDEQIYLGKLATRWGDRGLKIRAIKKAFRCWLLYSDGARGMLRAASQELDSALGRIEELEGVLTMYAEGREGVSEAVIKAAFSPSLRQSESRLHSAAVAEAVATAVREKDVQHAVSLQSTVEKLEMEHEKDRERASLVKDEEHAAKMQDALIAKNKAHAEELVVLKKEMADKQEHALRAAAEELKQHYRETVMEQAQTEQEKQSVKLQQQKEWEERQLTAAQAMVLTVEGKLAKIVDELTATKRKMEGYEQEVEVLTQKLQAKDEEVRVVAEDAQNEIRKQVEQEVKKSMGEIVAAKERELEEKQALHQQERQELLQREETALAAMEAEAQKLAAAADARTKAAVAAAVEAAATQHKQQIESAVADAVAKAVEQANQAAAKEQVVAVSRAVADAMERSGGFSSKRVIVAEDDASFLFEDDEEREAAEDDYMLVVHDAAARQIQAAARGRAARSDAEMAKWCERKKARYSWLRVAFKEADADQDGRLTRPQLQRLLATMPAAVVEPGQQELQLALEHKGLFAKLVMVTEKIVEREKAMDGNRINSNAAVSADKNTVSFRACARLLGLEGLMKLEWDRTWQSFTSADVDGDGQISYDDQLKLYTRQSIDVNEARTSAYIKEQFEKLDTNGNGFITRREYFAAAALPCQWAKDSSNLKWLAAAMIEEPEQEQGKEAQVTAEPQMEVQMHTSVIEMQIRTVETRPVEVKMELKMTSNSTKETASPNSTDTPTPVSNAHFMAMAVKLQSLFRARQDRKRICAHINALGGMLALPGTVQGRSGWYEYENTAMEFHVDIDGTGEEQWTQVGERLTLLEWKRKNRDSRE